MFREVKSRQRDHFFAGVQLCDGWLNYFSCNNVLVICTQFSKKEHHQNIIKAQVPYQI